MRLPTFLTLSAAFGLTIGAPALQRRNTEDYDIIVSKEANLDSILATVNLKKDSSDVAYVYDNIAFKGFSGSITPEEAETLNALSDVHVVAKGDFVTAHATRTNSPWGLQRISQSTKISPAPSPSAPVFTYTYEDETLGSGVDIYIVDTGINTEHVAFGGRAVLGFSAYSTSTDGYGHGTHCAGTAAGDVYGVSSNANLISVKILSDSGSGTTAAVLSGLDYVAQAHANRSTADGFIGSVASNSWGFNGGRQAQVDAAITALSQAGVHVAVAAGNSNTDACNVTPAGLGGNNTDVISVGASNINDIPSSFSNSGTCVDVWAPGEAVLSAWIGSTTATNVISGTSMATPHIAGLIAYLIAGNASLRDTAALKAYLTSTALPGVLSTRTGLVNGTNLILANNGVTDPSTVPSLEEAKPGFAIEAPVNPGGIYW